MALLQKQNVFLDEILVILSSLHHYTFQLPSNFLVRNIYIFHSRLQVNDQELWNFNSKSRLKINLRRNPDVTILILNDLLRFKKSFRFRIVSILLCAKNYWNSCSFEQVCQRSFVPILFELPTSENRIRFKH